MNNQYNLNLLLSQAYKTQPFLQQIHQLFLISPQVAALQATLFKLRNPDPNEALASVSTQKNVKQSSPSELMVPEYSHISGGIQSPQTINPLLLPISEPYLKEKQLYNSLAQNIELYAQNLHPHAPMVPKLNETLTSGLSLNPPYKIQAPGSVSSHIEPNIKSEDIRPLNLSNKLENIARSSTKIPIKKKTQRSAPTSTVVSADTNLNLNTFSNDTINPQNVKLEALNETPDNNEDLVPNESITIEPPALTALTKEFPDWDLGKIVEFVELGRGRNDLVKRPLRGAEDYAYEELFLQKEEEDESQYLSEEDKEERYQEYIKNLKGLLGYNELDLEKVNKILIRKKYNLHKALIFVRKNLSFYKKFFTLKNAQL